MANQGGGFYKCFQNFALIVVCSFYIHQYVQSNYYFRVGWGDDYEINIADAEVFNPTTKQWRNIKDLNDIGSAPTMHVVNGKLTVFGGFTLWGPGTSIEELNDDGESWSLMDSTLKHGFYLGVSVVVPSTKPN